MTTFATLVPSYLRYDDLRDLVKHNGVVLLQVKGKYVPDGTNNVRLVDDTVCAVETVGRIVRQVHDRVRLDA